MSKWSKETKEAMKDKVRAILVRKPRISNYELASILNIDRNTAYFMREDILREVRESVSKEVIMEEIGKFQQEIDALCLEAWDIVTRNSREIRMELYDKETGQPKLDKDGKQMYYVEKQVISLASKTRAMDLIGKLRNMILESKFSAGLFKKDWGNLGIDKMFDEKDKKLNELLDEVRKIKIDKDADNGVQNRKGADVEATTTGTDGIRTDSDKTVS
jgi:hypothetical protein